jgi:hypothetical protein
MSNSAEALRRWLGMFALATATGMLIWGRTILLPHLSGRWFVVYWVLCTVLALVAVTLGAVDVWIVLRTLHHDRQELARQARRGFGEGGRSALDPADQPAPSDLTEKR